MGWWGRGKVDNKAKLSPASAGAWAELGNKNIVVGDRHCKNCMKKNPFLDFTDENSQSRTCKECEEKKRF